MSTDDAVVAVATQFSLYLTCIDTRSNVDSAYADLNKLYEDGPIDEREVNIAKNALAIAVIAFEEARHLCESFMTTQ